MTTIDRTTLKNKLSNHENFKLVMTMDHNAFEQAHIPGSLQMDKPEQVKGALDPQDEVVVYCTNPACYASMRAYLYLRSLGFRKLYRYAGGLEDWQSAGLPLEGRMVTSHA